MTTLIERVITKLYHDNGKLVGNIKKIEKDYFDQGTWDFSIKVIDIDDEGVATMQLVADKLCPSGYLDNGIKVTNHFTQDLKKDFNNKQGMDFYVRSTINQFFESNRGVGGFMYKINHWSIK